MGLFERIRDERARINADSVVIQANQAALEAQLEQERKWRAEQRAEVLAAKQEAKEKAALKANLQNLLKIVGVRKQLQDLKKAWGAGRVDITPQSIPDLATWFAEWSHNHQQSETEESFPKVPGMALTLRHWFRDREGASIKGFNGWSDSDGSYYSKHGVSLQAIVGFKEDGSAFVTTLYGHGRIWEKYDWAHVYFYETAYVGGAKKALPAECMIHNPPEKVFTDNPTASKQVLEEQLFRIHEKGSSFRSMEEQARERIRADVHFPGRLYNLASPSWYKRLYGLASYYLHIPPS